MRIFDTTCLGRLFIVYGILFLTITCHYTELYYRAMPPRGFQRGSVDIACITHAH